jgi:CheY-like chemotaxis protein
MSRQFHILIVEDEEDWQEMLREASEVPNSSIEIAGTSDEALTLIHDKPFHLIIIDLSLIQGDGTNEEGMTLSSKIFESGLFNATKVIMISAYANPQRMRKAFGKYKVVDFVPKEEYTSKEFRKLVENVLEKEVNINLDLEIRWANQKVNIAQVVTSLLIDGKRVSKNSPLQNPLAEDLEDLLCRLFHKDKSILVKPLTPGGSGAAVLLVTPFSDYGAEQPVVVKFGHYNEIDREERNFKKYVQQFVGNSRHTSVRDLRRSLRLGGIVYSLIGGASDKIKSFRDFYSVSDSKQISTVLQKLFSETCVNWYANKSRLELVDLSEEYQKLLGFSWDGIEKGLNDLKRVNGKETLYFDALPEKRGFVNPVLLIREKEFPLSTYQCITHGDLNPDNVLLDGTGQSWLIDFGRTGIGHILRDIAELDTAVRYQLLKSNEADLTERLLLEEALNAAVNFSDVKSLNTELMTDNKAVAKSYRTVVELRKIAQQMVMQNSADDIKEYYLALIYYSLNSLRFYSWESIQREHALLSSCLLANQL